MFSNINKKIYCVFLASIIQVKIKFVKIRFKIVFKFVLTFKTFVFYERYR